MDINLLRKLDYYVGIPACFILTIINCFFPTRKSKVGGEENKILFIELSEMGSAILAYSSMHHVREMFAGSELYFLTFYKNRESVELLDVIKKRKCNDDT